MAINVSQAFKRTSANPIDESLALTKAQMLTVNDNLMPSKYLTVCQDDGKIYLYDKTNESDVETGRFRVFEGGSTVTVDPTPTQGSTNAVSSGGTYTALADKVDKVSGKQLSTEDYTTAEKTKLSGVETGAEVNTIEGITVNGDAITPDANKIAALTVLTNTVNNLLNYYTKTETYTKSEVDALVSAVAGATFVSVQTLPTTDIQTNVIYLVPKQTPETSNIKDEYINLDGTTAGWELIGDTGIDLSDYVTTTALNTALADYTTTADLTILLSGKVDKVNGKQLSTEDYTSAEKTKLAGLSNYDDTALSGRVSDIEDVVPSTATTSNKLATMADVVSGAGGHIIEDSTGVDMTTRTNLQFVGASVTDDSTNDRTVVTVNTSDKADKVASATNGNLASLDNNGNLADSGVASSDVVTTSSTAGLLKNDGTVDTTSYVSDISGKADKVTSATSGDLAGLDANGNITDSGVASNIFPSTATSSNKLATMADVGSGGQTIQYDTMPTASSENEDDIIQYVGATTQDYTNGYFYKCVAQGTDPETYAWEAQPVQEGADSRIEEEITDVKVNYDTTRSFRFVPIVSIDLVDLLTKNGRTITMGDIGYAYSLYSDGRITQPEYADVLDAFQIPSFSTISWSDVSLIMDVYYQGVIPASKITNAWSIGDSKTLDISAMPARTDLFTSDADAHSAQTVEMVIVDTNTYPLQTAIGSINNNLLTLCMKDTLENQKGVISNDGSNGWKTWENVPRRTWCNETFYSALPSSVKSMVKSVTREVNGVHREEAYVKNVVDKAFLPTIREYFGAIAPTYDVAGGSQFDYYSTASHRIKQFKLNGESQSSQYWLGSDCIDNSASYGNWWGMVSSDGTTQTGTARTNLQPLSVAFCI